MKKEKKTTTHSSPTERQSHQYRGGIPFGLFLYVASDIWICTLGSFKGALRHMSEESAEKLGHSEPTGWTWAEKGVALSPPMLGATQTLWGGPPSLS